MCGTYNCVVKLYIFCSYQFNPDLFNPDVVVNILIKSLTSVPYPDFNLCVSLLDERPPSDNNDDPDPLPQLLPILSGLHDLLYRCRFPSFWRAYHSEELAPLRENYTVEVSGFEDAVRQVAIGAIKAAFTSISLKRLESYLNLDGISSPEGLMRNVLKTLCRLKSCYIYTKCRLDRRCLKWHCSDTTES
jgi:translation initiation factor 3 subunit K